MKKIDLAQSLTLLANLGVIVGIGFLAIELQQNNELMEAEARFNRLSVSREAYNILSTNGELAAIEVKARNNEPLSEVEAYRFGAATMRFLSNMEWIFLEMPAESQERIYSERQLIRALTPVGPRREVFLDRRDDLHPDFVQWIEGNITLH